LQIYHYKAGNNLFKNEGCKQLPNLPAENLQQIILPACNIGAEGFSALVQANWTKISVIELCNMNFRKLIIKLGIKDAIIEQKRNGI
jgi:hypothetical protein